MNNKKEVWLPIKGYEGLYEISNLGKVKSLRFNKERILKGGANNKGYLHCGLSKNGKREIRTIHQLVAITFLNHKPCGYDVVVDHINNVRTDNRLENLQLVTPRENNSKDKKNGTSKYIGVYFHKTHKKWISRITTKGVEKHLGCFDCEIKAHLAYQKELSKLKAR